jgi:uncharacterized membrane protein
LALRLSQCSVCFAQSCLCLWIIISWLGIRFSHIVLSVLPIVACVSGLSFLDWPFGFHTMFCLLCPVLPLSLHYQFLIGPFVFTQYSLSCGLSCPCPWIIISWLVLRFSHNGLCLVALVACVSGLSFLDWPFGFHTMFCLWWLYLLVANSWLTLGILEAVNRRADNKWTKINVKMVNIDQ